MPAGRLCVAVATDDGERVKLGHFGDARFYYLYVLEDGGWRLERKIENPYTGHHHHEEEEEHHHHHHGHGHGHGGKRQRIYEMVKDCDAIVATALGPGGREFMESRGLKVVIVKPYTTVQQALEEAAKRLLAAEAMSQGA